MSKGTGLLHLSNSGKQKAAECCILRIGMSIGVLNFWKSNEQVAEECCISAVTSAKNKGELHFSDSDEQNHESVTSRISNKQRAFECCIFYPNKQTDHHTVHK